MAVRHSGGVALARKTRGYQQLVQKYEATAWLSRVGQGAYAKAGDKVEWTGGLYALQEQLKLPIHAGGKTALQMQGYAHFLPMGKGTTVSLFGTPDVKLPAWFKQYRWGVKVRYTDDQSFCRPSGSRVDEKRTGTLFDQSIRARARHDGSPVWGSASRLLRGGETPNGRSHHVASHGSCRACWKTARR